MEVKNYSEAMNRLESIIKKIENGEMDVDSLTDNLKEVKELVAYCKSKLLKVEEEVNKIMNKGES